MHRFTIILVSRTEELQ